MCYQAVAHKKTYFDGQKERIVILAAGTGKRGKRPAGTTVYRRRPLDCRRRKGKKKNGLPQGREKKKSGVAEGLLPEGTATVES